MDEEVEHFVGTEEFMFRIEDRQLQGIDDTAHGVDDAAGQQPEKSGRGQSFQQRPEYQDTYPAHGNVDHRGKPLGTGDPAGFYDQPTAAMPQTRASSVYPSLPPNTMRHTGV